MKLKNMRRSEDTEQIHVCNWAMWNENRYPELKWLHHIPNGGSRNKAEAVKLKNMGVKSGVADLHLPYAKGVYIGLYIEMKYGTGRHQDSQYLERRKDKRVKAQSTERGERMDDRERQSIREFYEVYNMIKQGRELRVKTRFTLNHGGSIQIFEGIGIHKKQILKVEDDKSWIECYRRATESLMEWERTEEQEARTAS